jgi:dynein heavy chain
MNPFTHGRTVLPDNLKSIFRMITMNMPNIGLIAEIVLYSAGFIGAQVLSKKIVRLFELSTDQMSS